MPEGESATLGVAELKRRTAKLDGGGSAVLSRATVIKDSGDGECDATNGIKICADFMAADAGGLERLKKYFGKFMRNPDCSTWNHSI